MQLRGSRQFITCDQLPLHLSRKIIDTERNVMTILKSHFMLAQLVVDGVVGVREIKDDGTVRALFCLY